MLDQVVVRYEGTLDRNLLGYLEIRPGTSVLGVRPLVLQGTGLGGCVEDLLKVIACSETKVKEIVLRRNVLRESHSAA